jgi:hypothetical protein
MPYPQLDRTRLVMKPLAARANRKHAERDMLDLGEKPPALPPSARRAIDETAERIRRARAASRPVMLAFGAHTIKNGLAPALIALIENGWITHLATNGAGVIHDWEFAFQGATSEDVRANVARGEFGNWRETGFYLNLALATGAYEGKGYGEAVGAMIHREKLTIPAARDLLDVARESLDDDPERAAAALDFLAVIRRLALPPGEMAIPHPCKRFSVQARAYELGAPFTGHPMIGCDIIYNHPANHGAALGRAALRDFLTFAEGVSRLDGGVYLSVGSAIMSPMLFEKSLSMARNLAQQEGRRIDNHFVLVVDLAESHWDWTRGEPPHDHPDYYLRFYKTFARMGGVLRRLQADNREFLANLAHRLIHA